MDDLWNRPDTVVFYHTVGVHFCADGKSENTNVMSVILNSWGAAKMVKGVQQTVTSLEMLTLVSVDFSW